MRLTSWQQICIYVAADTAITISARVFQMYCTWYFLTVSADKDSLSLFLLAIWLTSTGLLPFSGVLADRFKKSTVLLIAALLTLLASSTVIMISIIGDKGNKAEYLFPVFLVAGLVYSAGSALLLPLGTPLIPEITQQESTIHRGIRLKSSMYIVSLLCGPTLAGLMIASFGSHYVLWLCLWSACLGVVLSILFFVQFHVAAKQGMGNFNLSHLFRELVDGANRVWKIDAERTIAIASLFANMLLVPFLFLLLPAKILSLGYSMLDLALIEVSLGMGVLFTSGFLADFLKHAVSAHRVASAGVVLLGVSIFAFAYTGKLPLLCGYAFTLGVGLNVFNVTVNSKRAMCIPAGYRSGMEAILLFVCTAAAPFGLWVSRLGLHDFHPDSLIIFGSLTFIVAILLVILSAPLRLMLNAPSCEKPYYSVTNETLFQ